MGYGYEELNNIKINNIPIFLSSIKDLIIIEYKNSNKEDRLLIENWLSSPKNGDTDCLVSPGCKLKDSDNYKCEFCIYEYRKVIEMQEELRSYVEE